MEFLDLWSENVWLAARGGGIGSYWGNLRSIGEKLEELEKLLELFHSLK
jgi:ribonucleoside-diphosphate reductase alpha chain